MSVRNHKQIMLDWEKKQISVISRAGYIFFFFFVFKFSYLPFLNLNRIRTHTNFTPHRFDRVSSEGGSEGGLMRYDGVVLSSKDDVSKLYIPCSLSRCDNPTIIQGCQLILIADFS